LQYIKRVNDNENARKMLSDWGVEIHDSPVSLKARELAPETLYFGGNKQSIKGDSSWVTEISICPVITPVDISNWVILYTKRDERSTNVSRILLSVGGLFERRFF
jgi:hypothetical protein